MYKSSRATRLDRLRRGTDASANFIELTLKQLTPEQVLGYKRYLTDRALELALSERMWEFGNEVMEEAVPLFGSVKLFLASETKEGESLIMAIAKGYIEECKITGLHCFSTYLIDLLSKEEKKYLCNRVDQKYPEQYSEYIRNVLELPPLWFKL